MNGVLVPWFMLLSRLFILFAVQVAAVVVGLVIWERFLSRRR